MYLAFYKGRKAIRRPYDVVAYIGDWLTRFVTRGRYSHCEIAVNHYSEQGMYVCYSASIRDNGVRSKIMALPKSKWDLVEIKSDDLESVRSSIEKFFSETQFQAYDWHGAIGFLSKTRQRNRRWFCSEWCAEAIGLSQSWRYSPNDLHAIVSSDSKINF